MARCEAMGVLEALEEAKRLMYCSTPEMAERVLRPFRSVCVIAAQVRSTVMYTCGKLLCSAGLFLEAKEMLQEEIELAERPEVVFVASLTAGVGSGISACGVRTALDNAVRIRQQHEQGLPYRSFFALQAEVAVSVMWACYLLGDCDDAVREAQSLALIFNDYIETCTEKKPDDIVLKTDEVTAWWAVREACLLVPCFGHGLDWNELTSSMMLVDRTGWLLRVGDESMLTPSCSVILATRLCLAGMLLSAERPTSGHQLDFLEGEAVELAKCLGASPLPRPIHPRARFRLQREVNVRAYEAGGRAEMRLTCNTVSAFLWEVAESFVVFQDCNVEAELSSVFMLEQMLLSITATVPLGRRMPTAGVTFSACLVRYIGLCGLYSRHVLDCYITALCYDAALPEADQLDAVRKAMTAVMAKCGRHLGRQDALCYAIPQQFKEEESEVFQRFFDFLYTNGQKHHADAMVTILTALVRNKIPVTDEKMARVKERQSYCIFSDGTSAEMDQRYSGWVEGVGSFCDLHFQFALWSGRESAWRELRAVLHAVMKTKDAGMARLCKTAANQLMISYAMQARRLEGNERRLVVREAWDTRCMYQYAYSMELSSDLYSLELLHIELAYSGAAEVIEGLRPLVRAAVSRGFCLDELKSHFAFDWSEPRSCSDMWSVTSTLFEVWLQGFCFDDSVGEQRSKADRVAVFLISLAMRMGKQYEDTTCEMVEQYFGKIQCETYLMLAKLQMDKSR